MRERELIEWIRRQGMVDSDNVLVGPGDDCAVVRACGHKWLITTDQVLDGVHLKLSDCGPAAAGKKAASRALSMTSRQPRHGSAGRLRHRAAIQMPTISIRPASRPGMTPARNIRPTDTSTEAA